MYAEVKGDGLAGGLSSGLHQIYSRLCSSTYIPWPTPTPWPTNTPTPTPVATPAESPTPQPTIQVVEFQVNTFTFAAQRYPQVGCRPSGEFTVVWQSDGVSTQADGIFAQRYDADLSAVGGEFRVNLDTAEARLPRRPNQSSDASGRFVVVWEDYIGSEPDRFLEVHARRFDSSGQPLGDEFIVNTYTTGAQMRGAVAMEPDGDFVVAWQSRPQDLSYNGVFGQRFDSAGQRRGGEFQINQYTTSYQFWPSLEIDPQGGFVVIWPSRDQDGSGDAVMLRRYAENGTPRANEIQVNTYTTGHQSRPALAVDGEGGFIVVWTSSGQDGSQDGIFARRYGSTGEALTGELQVNTFTPGMQSFPAVAMDGAGRAVVMWESLGQDDRIGVYAQRLSASGAALGPEFAVNSYTLLSQGEPSLCFDESGQFVAAWQDGSMDSNGLDGQSWGVFARRFVFGEVVSGPELPALAAVTGLLLALALARRARRPSQRPTTKSLP